MKWKKVSEYPLPTKNFDKIYLLKLTKNYAYYRGYAMTDNPVAFKDIGVDAWCEFNPDEIESADCLDVHPVLKGKSQNTNPLPK